MSIRVRLLAVAIACTLAAPLVIAQSARVSDDPAATPAVNESANLWFVELASPPTADGTSPTVVRAEKAAFRRAAAAAGLRYVERFAYDVLFNGLSIRIDRAQASRLSRIDGVKAVYPVVSVEAPPVEVDPGSSADLAAAITMTGADIVQTQLGYTGAGVKVAIMDTGIDIDHPDLGGNGVPGGMTFPTTRVIAGWDFVGDAYNADPTSPTYNPNPVPDPNPDDCAGHGSHVAGIVGANGMVTGVAPGVSFGAYRVFGCEGSTESDIMVAAMERALADKMQVLNMSIGSAFQWPQYPTAIAATRLVNKGVVVVASIGNNGTNGLYAAGAPGVGEKVIGTASFDNVQITLPYFTVSPDAAKIGYNAATGAPLPPTSGTYPMARTGTATTANDACNAVAPPAGSLTGKVALIRRGTCSFYEKAWNAMSAGAIGVVLYNNTAGRVSPTVAGTPPITIPVVAISDTEGVLIDGRLAAGPVDMTWTDQVWRFGNTTGGLISSFSSYGVAADLSTKPDIGAPGGSIYSTYPIELGSYANLSGTSMSSPHIAGAAALLLQAKPRTPAQAVRAILQNTAVPKNWWGNPGLGFLDQVHRQGAGMLAIDKAILSTTKIEPGKLSLGESEWGPATRTLSIENNSKTAVTYTIGHEPALSTGPNTFTVAALTGFATVVPSVPQITVPAKSTMSVDVTITANPALTDKSLYGGYIVFTPMGGGQVYRVPYTGFKGDYQSIVALTPTANGFPWLAKLVGTSYLKQNAGAIFTMAGTDTPFFLFHLDHQVRRGRLEVFDAVTGKAWFRALDEEYWGRNSTATSFFAVGWDGTTRAGRRTYTVPNGQYVVVMSVLKANGDPANPAHWETWTSPAFYIAR